MPEIPSELLYNWRIWWDPGPDGPYGPHVPWETQQKIAAVVLNARAQMLKVQADAFGQIAGFVAGAKAATGQ
jgi:hypothetical protein